jgi:predicted ATPase/DNA-binding SARP family transcriptional activator
MSRLTLYLLGSPRIEWDGERVDIHRRKAVALLAYLAVTGGSHSRDALATLFWPEYDQSRARAGLRRALSSLKTALGEGWLVVDRESVRLNHDGEVWLDVDEFQALLAACHTHDHPEDQVCPDCLPLLAEAAELYRDDFLAGFTLRDSPGFDEWQFFQSQGLRVDLASGLERLVHGHRERGEYQQAIAYGRRWLALDPLHEPAHRHLMGLYAQSGQRAAALRQYAECERILQEELGVSPEEETAQLYQAIKKCREGTAADSRPERYRLERKLSSKGGFGEVWLATDTLLDRPVAVKCPKATDDSLRRERFLVEARMLARLNHPNITQIHDAFFDEREGNLYLVMEYVDGRDLSDIIKAGTSLPLDIILEVAVGILRALSYAHEQGIVHRDVKPANVMIAEEVKLMDFGLANLRSILGRGTGSMAGTPAYMAPEQIEGRAVDGRADLYALGVILFEMLSGGHLPFEHTDQVEMLDAHLHTPSPPISQFAPTVPPVLEQVVMRLLAKDPEERYPSAEVVVEVLAAIDVGPKLTNLPVPLTPFVGREAELAEIQARLGDPTCRLLTLVGPGGCGKTRLALVAAEAQIDSYPHGVFFVSLAPLDSVDSIVPTVAEALGFRFYEEGEPQQQLLDYLRQKRMLLILDNFEHLVEGAGLVTEILQTAPEVQILATSRARLNVGGEHLFPVVGMHFPDEETIEDATQYSAIKLFLSNVCRTQPSFEPSADELTEVVRICRLVDGMPLGILLAAAWADVLTPLEIAAEISRGLDFLETDLRDVPERQRSMRAVFDHSWKLLTEREKEVFQGLSVFRGGFTCDAAQKATDASLRDLMVLVHKSLLHRTARGRYGMHELLRGYAAEKLDGSPAAGDAARDRHSAYYVAALQRWEADLKGPRQQTALAEMDTEIENARAAWDWAVERGQVEQLEHAVDGLCRFYRWRGRYQEGEVACRTAAERLAAKASGDSIHLGYSLRLLAKILTWQSVCSQALGRPERASQLLRQSLVFLEELELAGQDSRPERAVALLEMGWIAYGSNREEARRLFEQSLALYHELGDQWGTANALDGLAGVARSLGPYDEAKQLDKESLAIRQALGDQRGVADSLMMLAMTALAQGQLEEAERLVREGFVICQRMGDRVGIADGLIYLGGTLLVSGKYGEAHSLLEESVAIHNDLGSRSDLAYSKSILGAARMHLGQYEGARVCVQMGLTLSREAGYRFGIGYSCFLLSSVALAGEAYGEAQQLLEESVAVCREVGRQDELGWALAALGITVRGLGQRSQAREHLSEALRTAVEIGAFAPLLYALPGIAVLLVDQGEQERAVELYALASRYPFVANSRWFEDIVGKHIAAVAATLPPEVVAAAQARGRARDLEATVKELLVELEG